MNIIKQKGRDRGKGGNTVVNRICTEVGDKNVGLKNELELLILMGKCN
jgi:hypothetical protein